MVRLTLETNDYLDIELYETVAPITVANFLNLVKAGFYDGLIFHRIIRDFMVQGGGYKIENNELVHTDCPSIKGEFRSNGVDNKLKHTKGVISMARTNVKDSASSQFFICTADTPHLDGEYAAFGKIVGEESFKTLDKLNDARTVVANKYFTDFPYPYIVIKKMEVL